MAVQQANVAAKGTQRDNVPDHHRRETSLSHMSRAATEARTRATKEWISLHVKAERGYRPPGGKDLQRRQLRRTRKPLAERHYQLLSGYVTIGSFLHDRLGSTGQERCWCSSRRRQSRHHLFVWCRAWAPRIKRLWKRAGKDCGWKHPRASVVRLL